MEYVKELLSKPFKEHLSSLKKLEDAEKLKRLSITQVIEHKRNIYPKLRQLIYVSRLIMTMNEIETYLMPYREMVELEREICKPLNTLDHAE